MQQKYSLLLPLRTVHVGPRLPENVILGPTAENVTELNKCLKEYNIWILSKSVIFNFIYCIDMRRDLMILWYFFSPTGIFKGSLKSVDRYFQIFLVLFPATVNKRYCRFHSIDKYNTKEFDKKLLLGANSSANNESLPELISKSEEAVRAVG